jgi:predicted N-acetyltransferase YhbS
VNINLSIFLATADDAAAIADVITEASQDLTDKHGQGQWSAVATKKGILSNMSKARVLVAKVNNTVVGTLRLTASRPWVIDPAYFTPVYRPIYLVDMAVRPGYQRIGVGRALILSGWMPMKELPAPPGFMKNAGLPKWAILSIKKCRTFILNG